MKPTVIAIEAGPAGLTEAWELHRHGLQSTLGQTHRASGIPRTKTYKDYRFDIGGHRFFTRFGEISVLWQKILGNDSIRVPRLSRIYYGGRFYDYSPSLAKTLRNLGPLQSLLILVSRLNAKLRVKIMIFGL